MSSSPDWDALWRKGGFNRWPSEELVRWASTLEKGSKVLEVGCGAGANLRALEDFGLETWGVDLSTEAIDVSVPLRKASRIAPVSATELPFDDQTFDAVCDVQCFQHLTEDELLIAYSEAFRVLKPDGRFFSQHLIEGQQRFEELSFCDPSIPGQLAVGFKNIARGYLARNWDGDKVTYALFDMVKPC